ncbi:MAG: hypothetical protein ACOX7C_07055 [Brevefilum sp.]
MTIRSKNEIASLPDLRTICSGLLMRPARQNFRPIPTNEKETVSIKTAS